MIRVQFSTPLLVTAQTFTPKTRSKEFIVVLSHIRSGGRVTVKVLHAGSTFRTLELTVPDDQ